jgi:hypothetical protein
MGETAKRKPGRIQKWRDKRRIRGEERRRVRAERALDAAQRNKGAQKWGGPMSGG